MSRCCSRAKTAPLTTNCLPTSPTRCGRVTALKHCGSANPSPSTGRYYGNGANKRGFIAARRQAGLQSLLKPLLGYGGPLSTDDGAEMAGALAWKYTLGDADAKREVDELLKQAHLSDEAIDGEVMGLHIATLETFDHLIWAAEKGRDACLREIEYHRAPFGRALRRAITSVEADNIRTIEPPVEQKKAA